MTTALKNNPVTKSQRHPKKSRTAKDPQKQFRITPSPAITHHQCLPADRNSTTHQTKPGPRDRPSILTVTKRHQTVHLAPNSETNTPPQTQSYPGLVPPHAIHTPRTSSHSSRINAAIPFFP